MDKIKIADSAILLGKVRLGNGVYVAQGSTIRSNNDSVSIGSSSWVLEQSTIIGTERNPIKVGRKTVFGHKCIAIGTEIGDLCEIGNGTILMPGSKLGNMCIVGESTIIPEGMVIPDKSVVLGRPARIIREVTKEDEQRIIRLRGNDATLPPFEEYILDYKQRESDTMGKLYETNGKFPIISETSYIYDSAEINGDVLVGENVIIGPGVKIVGDSHGPVKIGNNVQILENCVLHLLPDNELIIEDNVIIGPGSIIHGTIIGEGTIVESGVNISDYSTIGKGCLVRAGSLVKQGSEFPNNSIIEGFPAVKVGDVDKLNESSWGFNYKNN